MLHAPLHQVHIARYSQWSINLPPICFHSIPAASYSACFDRFNRKMFRYGCYYNTNTFSEVSGFLHKSCRSTRFSKSFHIFHQAANQQYAHKNSNNSQQKTSLLQFEIQHKLFRKLSICKSVRKDRNLCLALKLDDASSLLLDPLLIWEDRSTAAAAAISSRGTPRSACAAAACTASAAATRGRRQRAAPAGWTPDRRPSGCNTASPCPPSSEGEDESSWLARWTSLGPFLWEEVEEKQGFLAVVGFLNLKDSERLRMEVVSSLYSMAPWLWILGCFQASCGLAGCWGITV